MSFINYVRKAKDLFLNENEKYTKAVKGIDLGLARLATLYQGGKIPKEITLTPGEVDTLAHKVVSLKGERKTGYFKASEHNIPRPVQITDDGRVFVHYSKKDELLWEGGGNKIKAASDITNDKIYVRRTRQRLYCPDVGPKNMEEYRAEYKRQNEILDEPNARQADFYKDQLKDKEHFVEVIGKTTFIAKDEAKKTVVLMEFCEDGSLAKIVDENTAPFETRLDVSIGVLKAAKVMHKKNIVHKDLKPENILQNGKQIKITDFDEAIVGEFIECPVSGSTQRYVPPGGSRSCLKANDIFALGMTLKDICFGRDDRTVSQIRATLSDPKELATLHIIEKMLEPKLENRTITASQALKQLSNLQKK